MIRNALILIAALTLTGCATNDAGYYKAIEARAKAEEARFNAIASIGSTGTDVARVASVMALQERGGAGQAQIAPPRTPMDNVLQAVGILAPALVQAYGIRANTQLGMAQSNNGARVAESTNATFLGMAGRIQAPAANVSNVATTTNTTTDSRVTDNSVRTRTDNSQRTADSGNTVTTTTVGANSGANSGNSGRIAGTSMVDSTTPAPAPVIVPAQVVNPVVVQPVVVQP